jgi:glycosyltransferase involved in cell wall biosynthesis
MGDLVSIVLPVYNGLRYLAKSIESCLKQTYHNLELIIVNDCSTDDSLAVAEAYATQDRRVSIINNETNQQLPRSLNIGFATAKGEYLTWTSDDNIYKPNAIEVMANRLVTNQDVGFVYTDCDIIDENGEFLRVNRGQNNYGYPDEMMIQNCVQACFMYRRAVYEAIGDYNPNKEMIEDWDYWVRIWLKFKVLHIPQSLYKCRMHPDSLTSTRHIEQMTKAVEFIIENNDRNTDKIPEDIRMRGYLYGIALAKRCGNDEQAQKCLRLARNISLDAATYLSKQLSEYVQGLGRV